MQFDLNRWFFSRHLHDDEELNLVVHKHWFIGVKFLIVPILSFLFCIYLITLFPLYTVIYYIVSIWAVVSLVWLLRNFFDYYLDAWVITTDGIIDVAWHGWFHRTSTRVLYSDIQGVSYEIQGVLNTVFSFGTLSAEKISTGNAISLDSVPKPREIEQKIMKYMEDYMNTNNLKDSKHVQELLSTIIAREIQLEDFDDSSNDE
ncbi:PH domain-containing protein [Candidatus Peregrinibacteria bacterium]|jgi:hypothetical protein|nr:PH domain-containing protein [Candidatus Peregrinibacteria bacterium]MBT3598892.1 PH domain-containing protein [Candidatus Peregrinibacteria bacterium]MBT4367325.1 PH domain-containing protein [Candidatus Peregrinibacteria bacterium]MBT4585780.1 PH domain-containing protein [Candidatus Peregrinibacteria bacterium]MBT6730711.1 PH domain-containing protein [Candidatus Peregrinibacteria bacterium]